MPNVNCPIVAHSCFEGNTKLSSFVDIRLLESLRRSGRLATDRNLRHEACQREGASRKSPQHLTGFGLEAPRVGGLERGLWPHQRILVANLPPDDWLAKPKFLGHSSSDRAIHDLNSNPTTRADMESTTTSITIWRANWLEWQRAADEMQGDIPSSPATPASYISFCSRGRKHFDVQAAFSAPKHIPVKCACSP
jgi:hypothetical protein